MSRWTHSICRVCWKEKNPDGREPVTVKDAEEEICCFCGSSHQSSIYIRENWAFTQCRGETGIHREVKV